MLTDHFFPKWVHPPPSQDPFYTYRWTDIQTDGDYIKRVVHGPPGDHTLKNAGVDDFFFQADKPKTKLQQCNMSERKPFGSSLKMSENNTYNLLSLQ